MNVRFRLVWRTVVPKDLGPSEDPAAWYRDELRKHIRKGKLLKITNMSQDKEMSEINKGYQVQNWSDSCGTACE